MFKSERQNEILKILKNEGRLIASELPKQFNVSIDTIRRDLDQLHEANKLQRTHGGAILKSTVSKTFEGREKQSLKGKNEIANTAIKLLKPKQNIIIDGGTTMLALAQNIPLEYEGRIITHSPRVISILTNHRNIELIMIGGKYNKNARVNFGSDVVNAYKSFNADICFLGVASLNAEIGVGAMYYDEMLVRKQIIKSSNQRIVLATKEKLGITSPFIVTTIDEITYIVTENDISENILKSFKEKKIEIIKKI